MGEASPASGTRKGAAKLLGYATVSWLQRWPGARTPAPPSPVCDRLWIFRFSRREKLLLQVGQRCGFSLVCVRMWMSILYLLQGGHRRRTAQPLDTQAPLPTHLALPHLALKPRPWRAQPSQWQQ